MTGLRIIGLYGPPRPTLETLRISSPGGRCSGVNCSSVSWGNLFSFMAGFSFMDGVAAPVFGVSPGASAKAGAAAATVQTAKRAASAAGERPLSEWIFMSVCSFRRPSADALVTGGVLYTLPVALERTSPGSPGDLASVTADTFPFFRVPRKKPIHRKWDRTRFLSLRKKSGREESLP